MTRTERMLEMDSKLRDLKKKYGDPSDEVDAYMDDVMDPHWYSLSPEERETLMEHYKGNKEAENND